MLSIKRWPRLIVAADAQGLESMGWPQYSRPEETVKEEKIRPFAYMIGGSYTTAEGKAEASFEGPSGSAGFSRVLISY
jgi:hypothetical protein